MPASVPRGPLHRFGLILRDCSSRLLLVVVTLAASPWRLPAHDGRPIEPHDLLAAWSFEPFVIVALLTSAFLYARGYRAMRARRRDRGRRWPVVCFISGWVVLAVALVSPLHALGGALFSAHMVQHELLMAVAAPLLVLGRPLVPMLWALPMRWRRASGRFASVSWIRVPWRILTASAIAWLAHAIAIWAWHLPGPYQSSLNSELAHSSQHASFLLTALLFWWALIHGRGGRMGYGAAVLYVFGTALHTSILGALLTFSDVPWYPQYGRSTMQWGLTVLEDQHLAGLIMWIPAAIAYVVAALWLLASWLRDSERRVVAREAEVAKQGQLTTRYSRATALFVMAGVLVLNGCDIADDRDNEARMLVGGDPEVGKDLIRAFGCGSCHAIPGVRGATAIVGPPLQGIASRAYIAGVLTNTPANMQRWVRDPKAVDSLTAMPNVGLNAKQAQHVTAYLYTLR